MRTQAPGSSPACSTVLHGVLLLKRQGIPLVVSGPSGVGKGTVIRGLMSRRPELARSISCTTREPRPGETRGQEYHFVTPAEFRRMREGGQLLEWATVHRDISYGTPRAPVEAAIAAGQDIVLEIDYQGARSVRQLLGNLAVLTFIAPPSWEDLRARLVGRETESPEDVSRRLGTARAELANIDLFQYVVVNREVEQAVDELEAILVAERARLSRVEWRGLQGRIQLQAGGVETP